MKINQKVLCLATFGTMVLSIVGMCNAEAISAKDKAIKVCSSNTILISFTAFGINLSKLFQTLDEEDNQEKVNKKPNRN